ncbi:hypothetical protein SO802_032366 [Lithocarpus litseifolius]|uniref:PPIase cyclophilin-type domain-containing protein n=1 Tax=Lithocarpus litseifolius TaxID=425828 RepID=A0AAW2BRD5_9ROSI
MGSITEKNGSVEQRKRKSEKKINALIPSSNEHQLSSGEKVVRKSGKLLHYNGCTFHRIIPYFMIQGSNFALGSGRVLHSQNFSCCPYSRDVVTNMKYISELVTDLPIVSTFWACDPNVRGTPRISSIPLSALGVLDGDGLHVPLL